MDIVILIMLCLNLCLSAICIYFHIIKKESKNEAIKEETEEEYVLRIKPNFKNPLKNYDAYYEKRKGLLSPVRAGSKESDTN